MCVRWSATHRSRVRVNTQICGVVCVAGTTCSCIDIPWKPPAKHFLGARSTQEWDAGVSSLSNSHRSHFAHRSFVVITGATSLLRHQPSEGGVPPTSEPPTHHLAARHVFTSSSARALDPAPSITISVPWDLVGLLHVAVVGAAEGRSVAAHRTCAAPPPVLLPPPRGPTPSLTKGQTRNSPCRRGACAPRRI